MPGALHRFRRFISFCTSFVVIFLISGVSTGIFNSCYSTSGFVTSSLGVNTFARCSANSIVLSSSLLARLGWVPFRLLLGVPVV
jgi:hypothetical protein